MEEEYPSDTSDEDYNPLAESDGEDKSNEEDADLVSEEEENDSSTKKRQKRKNKKRKIATKPEGPEDNDNTEIELTEEEKKKRTDSLWNDFKKDANTQITSKSNVAELEKPIVAQKVTKIYEFAGEQVKISEDIKATPSSSTSSSTGTKRGPPLKTGGLSNIAGLLGGKKQKLSTLEKSKLDWDTFKKDEGIEDDLKTYNQGKMGYLERQAFLERTDHKQFEIERSFRLSRKTNR